MRSSMMAHPVDTTLVVIYPVDHAGHRLLPLEKDKNGVIKRKKGDTYPESNIITIDGERVVVTRTGTLIERWKADHVLDSLVYRHLYTEDFLRAQGVSENDPEFNLRLSQATDLCKFAVREPSHREMMTLTAPIDEDAFDRAMNLSDTNRKLGEDYGDALRAAMRANPDVPAAKLFEAFGLAFASNKT